MTNVNDDLLKAAEKNDEDISFQDLPVPPDMPQDLKEGVKAETFDSKIYEYPELVKKLEDIPNKAKIPTFFQPVDSLLDGGFHGGELVILSAPTKAGKTTLAQTFSFLQAQNGLPSLWFSLEMSWQELTRKFLEMDKAELISTLSGKEPPSPLSICYPIQNRSLELKWMEKQIAKAQKEHGVQMVYIDHLHFLLPLKDFNTNVSFLVGGIVRELKQIAVRLDIPILLIAHMRKLEDVKKRPDINTIRDSSFIAQESDFTFIMWRRRKKGVDTARWDDNAVKRAEQNQSGIPEENIDESNEDIYEDAAMLSLEANRRTGKTRKMVIEYINNRFFPAGSMDIQEQVTHMQDKAPEKTPEQEKAEMDAAAALLSKSVEKSQVENMKQSTLLPGENPELDRQLYEEL